MAENPEPSFTKDNVTISDPEYFGGKYKRVFKVEIEGPDGKRKAMLKLPRIYKANSNNTRLTEPETQQIDEEAQDLRKLKMLIPSHVPGYLGKYESNVRDGTLVEPVEGEMIADRSGNILKRPTQEQWARFENSIKTLMDQGVYLDLDTILLHNLMLGKLPNSDQEEVILIEPKIISANDDAGREMNTRFTTGGLQSDFKVLFPPVEVE